MIEYLVNDIFKKVWIEAAAAQFEAVARNLNGTDKNHEQF
jgi:hypothetical protein